MPLSYVNWTVLELVTPMIGRKRIPLLKVECVCSNIHLRSLEAVLNTTGHCVDCGVEDPQNVPILNPYEQVKIGEVINSLIFQREQTFSTPSGRSYKSWVAICSLCQSEQRTNKYLIRERCNSCLGVFGQKFNQLKLISIKSIPLNTRGPALGDFLCDCGLTETFKIERVLNGNLQWCKTCGHKKRSERMKLIAYNTKNALEENKKLKEELERYKLVNT